eukprot:1780823-Pyramimonas_sp.AAC.1
MASPSRRRRCSHRPGEARRLDSPASGVYPTWSCGSSPRASRSGMLHHLHGGPAVRPDGAQALDPDSCHPS